LIGPDSSFRAGAIAAVLPLPFSGRIDIDIASRDGAVGVNNCALRKPSAPQAAQTVEVERPTGRLRGDAPTGF
jgi:hypothetical protein